MLYRQPTSFATEEILRDGFQLKSLDSEAKQKRRILGAPGLSIEEMRMHEASMNTMVE